MRALLATALLLLPLAGCLLPDRDDRPDYGAVEEELHAAAAPILVQDHDHFLARLHAGAFNLERVGYHNGVDESGDPQAIPAAGYYTELAVVPGRVYLARHSADGSFGGFSIIGTEDPADPVLLGSFPAMGGSDLEVSDDGRFVFFATQRNGVEEIAGHVQSTQEPAGVRGISVVDVSDASNPRLAFFQPLPVNGPHTLTYHRHEDGDEYLVACTYDLVTDPATGALVAAVPVTQRVLVFRVERSADGATALPVLVSQYQIAETPRNGRLFFPHDTTVQRHPLDGRTLLYVAYWDKGAQLLDLSDPANPTPISAFTDFSPSKLNAIHLVRAFDDLVDGRHVTVTEPEIVSADETGRLFFLDTTDPAHPQKMGNWKLPADLVVEHLDFSPHNFDTFDGKVALGHYHAGVWVIDASDAENLEAPKTVGFYMPTEPAREGSPYPQPFVWGVFEQDGLLYVSDQSTGLHILRYTGP